MRVLVVGGGGREHALCWSLAKSPNVERMYAAPGNAGIGTLADPVAIAATDVAAMAEFAERESIDLTVVGPEVPLVGGLVDELDARGLRAFGPNRAGARIEGSKTWARALCEQHGIPSPRSKAFEAIDPAMEHLEDLRPPYVVKADGLAAGKGVTVAESQGDAENAVRACLVDGAFGEAGRMVLIEEYLEGEEVSAMALVDGRHIVPLAFAQDYKRVFDDNGGPNTGGMGAFSPVPFVEPETAAGIEKTVLQVAADALADEGIRYRGILYAGLMLAPDGPRVLEFNCRFGDPETQVVLPRLGSNLADALLACVDGTLQDHRPVWRDESCVGVVAASAGYPGPVQTGMAISGLEEAAGFDDVVVFHSGTATGDGRVITAGGRVLTVSALGPTHEDARARAYEALSRISFDGMQHRRDIARDLPQRAPR